MADHPVMEAIRDRLGPLEEERAQLVTRLEEIELEAGALANAERAMIKGLVDEHRREKAKRPPRDPGPAGSGSAPADADEKPAPRKPASNGRPPAVRSLELFAEAREAICGYLGRARGDGWVSPRDLLNDLEMPRTRYQKAIRQLHEDGKVEQRGSRTSLAYRLASGGDPPKAPESPSEPDPDPGPQPAPRSPTRARRRRRPQHPAPPPAPAPTAPSVPTRSSGVEAPPAPQPEPSSAPHIQLTEGDYDIVDLLEHASAPLTAGGIAVKLKVPVAAVAPRLEALVNGKYLQRGASGTVPVYAVGTRAIPRRGPSR